MFGPLANLDEGPGAALLEATVALGYSEPVARSGLEAEVAAWCLPGAIDAVSAELPKDLDPRRVPATVLVIAASTVVASTLRAVGMARLLGSRVLLKAATGQEPIARAIAAADDGVQPISFDARDGTQVGRALEKADTVVVLGRDETIASVRAHLAPGQVLVGYGHRLSVAWLGPWDPANAPGLAQDLCAWDQSGCLSPQVAWVDGPVAKAAEDIADALSRIEETLPMDLPVALGRPRAVARALGDMGGRTYETKTGLMVALDDPTFRPSPGHRTLWVLPAQEEALLAMAPLISTVGTGRNGIRPPLQAGVRTCPVGSMQDPPLTWQHDGMPNLTPLLLPG